MDGFYPDMIASLPEADLPISGVCGRLFQGEHGQIVFFSFFEPTEVPPHSHGDQWGVVLDGEVELTIGGETKTYRAGDHYFIPAGTTHAATFHGPCRLIDFFADKDRYAPK